MSDNGLRIVWIYPDLLSTYGDQGNVLVVERRAGSVASTWPGWTCAATSRSRRPATST
ncbi:Lipid II isoglutaminyl synthase (glutamine-hydrolyzing) subunit GatD [Streptomyces hirsutus]